MRGVLILIALLSLAGLATAGSRDAPEVPDAQGDCSFAAGNEYADMVAAWISDETAMDFLVHIQLAKWTQDALGSYVGYTLQFTHQGVQWGVAGFYDPQNGWGWNTAQINAEQNELSNFSETTGTWDAATATMSIAFPKSLFPHSGTDNKLTGFSGGSADFKKDIPIFIAQGAGAPVPSQDFLICDLVESSAVYEFTVGQHTMAPATPDAPTDATSDAAVVTPTPATTAPTAPRDTPGIGAAGLVAVLACLAAFRRRP